MAWLVALAHKNKTVLTSERRHIRQDQLQVAVVTHPYLFFGNAPTQYLSKRHRIQQISKAPQFWAFGPRRAKAGYMLHLQSWDRLWRQTDKPFKTNGEAFQNNKQVLICQANSYCSHLEMKIQANHPNHPNS